MEMKMEIIIQEKIMVQEMGTPIMVMVMETATETLIKEMQMGMATET